MSDPINQTPSTRPPTGEAAAPAALPRQSAAAVIRELADELVFVFVLVMFMKMFLVELYKIPSGSMTPTLLGGEVAFVDADGDSRKDLVYWNDPEETPQVFVRQDDHYQLDRELRPTTAQTRQWIDGGLAHRQSDYILVDKLAYWRRWPRRGEIVVFKVPPPIFQPEAPIYIKRLVGEPGDTLSFTEEGRLVVNGRPAGHPAFFDTQHYQPIVDSLTQGFRMQPEIDYESLGGTLRRIERIKVPPGEDYVFGDNADSSLDSRFWGGVPQANFKGRAFMRIFPFNQIKFLK